MHLRNLVCLISFFFCSAVSLHAHSQISGPVTFEFGHSSTEVLSWSWAASRASDGYHVGGGGYNPASFAGITISRLSDENTANLLNFLANGDRIQRAVLRRDGMTITLQDVLVTSYAVHGVSSKREPQAETIDLTFARIRFEIGGQAWSWDIPANR